MNRYNHTLIEKKWQGQWLKEKIYEPDLKSAKKPFYNLMMFPYPSAEGLHVGNMYAFTGSDIYGRFKRMQGYDVFEPIGLDGFGIHSENYALKTGRHPMDQAKISEKNFYRQLEMLGNSFVWNKKLETYDPEYYKWTQWIFVQMFQKGLAYRKKSPVNWCPSCKTVLADEQVIKKSKIKNQKSKIQVKIQNEEASISVCERCDTPVIKKDLEQWFFRITNYAERLLKNLETLDWSEKIKVAQRNWIGKSEGALIKFSILNSQFSIEVFTTRPDTLFGATYLVLSPEHKIISNFQFPISNRKEVDAYIKKAKLKSDEERIAEGKVKTGVELKGVKAINPTNSMEIPIWVADYVLSSYGTGAIMAVPAHDERDFEFAQKYKLPITRVIEGGDLPYVGDGKIINSGKFSGMDSEKAKWEITQLVGGKKKIQYRLRDWLISRQRYWGPPIPLVFCENCAENIKYQKSNIKNSTDYNLGEIQNPGWVAVSEKDLPVQLPRIKNFRPTGTDQSPLALIEKFYKVRCPKCNSWARRETDVSDTFLDSAWYYLGYLILGNQKSPPKADPPLAEKIKNQKFNFEKDLIKKWLPVDMYIGGVEHAVLHLLYVRFLAMVLQDLSLIHFEEPFKKFRAHGLIIKDGAKMSKSKGNVINPDDYIKRYGADALRMYLMFLGPFENGGDFQDTGIKGVTRFFERVWKCCKKSKIFSKSGSVYSRKNPKLLKKIHQTIKKVTEDIENLQYNTAISALMILLNEIEVDLQSMNQKDIEAFLKLLAPFAPHITEELWHNLGNEKSIHVSKWPDYNPEFIIENEVDFIIQINGKTRAIQKVSCNASQAEMEQAAKQDQRLSKYLSGTVKKVIFVPNKLINFVL